MVSEEEAEARYKRRYIGYAHLIKVKENGGWDTRLAEYGKKKNNPNVTWEEFEARPGAQVGNQSQLNRNTDQFPEEIVEAYKLVEGECSATKAHGITSIVRKLFGKR